jgi:hypothetical protein
MTLRGANERLLPLGDSLTSGLYTSHRDPYKAGRWAAGAGRLPQAACCTPVRTAGCVCGRPACRTPPPRPYPPQRTPPPPTLIHTHAPSTLTTTTDA